MTDPQFASAHDEFLARHENDYGQEPLYRLGPHYVEVTGTVSAWIRVEESDSDEDARRAAETQFLLSLATMKNAHGLQSAECDDAKAGEVET